MKVFVTGTRGIPGVMGGVETHCEHLYPRLAAMGYDITVVRRDSYVAGDYRTRWQGVNLVDIATPRKKAFEAIVHTVRAVVAARRAKADLLHIHAVGPSLAVPLAKLLGMRVVMTNHGPDYERAKWGRLARTIIKMGAATSPLAMAAHAVYILYTMVSLSLRYVPTTHTSLNSESSPDDIFWA